MDDMSPEAHQARIALGAYVLGALEPAERAELEGHLGGCAGCREELAGLAGLPGLLGRLDAADVEVLAGPSPAQPLERALAELTRRRRDRRRNRRRGFVLAVAAAVTIGAVGAGGTVAVTGSSAPDFRVDAGSVASSGASASVQATAQLGSRPWGTQVTLRLSGVPTGTRCRLIAVARGGGQEVAGTWQVGYTGQASVEGATAIPRPELLALHVLDQNDARIAVLPTG